MQNPQNVSQHAAASQENPAMGNSLLPRIHIPAMTGRQLGEMLATLRETFSS